MHIRLNLATRPLVSHRRFMLGTAVLGVLGLAVFLLLGLRFYILRKADEDYRARAEKIQEEMTRLQEQRDELKRFFEKDENRSLQERAKFTVAVIESRSFDWTKMFMDLEHTLPAGVHVLRIEPRLDRGTASVRFVVGAASPEAKIHLLKSFEDSKSFSHIELLSQDLPRQGSTDALVLEFTAIYTGIG